MGTALQKPWMKDLPLPVIALAKKKAVEATAAWNDTVAGTLKAARAVYDVREKIGGVGGHGPSPGAFSAWAEEEFHKAHSTASALATIGARHKELVLVQTSLPASWVTLYELAKVPDGVFRRALRRVKPDMERNEMICLVMEEAAGEEAPRQKKKKTAAIPAASRSEKAQEETAVAPTPRQAANLTIAAGAVWRLVKDFSAGAEEALAAGALSPEAKKFMVHNYIDPSVELLSTLKVHIEESLRV